MSGKKKDGPPKLTIAEAADTGYTIGALESILARVLSQKPPFTLLVTPHDQEALAHALKFTRNALQCGDYGTEYLMPAKLWRAAP